MFEVQSKQLLVILHPSNNSVEVIVLPLSDSHEDVIRAEEVRRSRYNEQKLCNAMQ